MKITKKTIKIIYIIYVFTFSAQLMGFLVPVKNLFSSAASIGNGLFLMLVGIIAILLLQRGKVYINWKTLTGNSIILVFALALMSTVTSVLLYDSFGSLYGENTLTASLPSTVYMLLLGVVFYFNSLMLKFISKRELEKVLDVACLGTIILGFIQILVIFGGNFVGEIYDKLDVLDIFVDSNRLISMKRICVQGSEPASIGDILFVLFVPYLMGRILNHDAKKLHKIMIILSLPIAFFTFSSTVYIGVVVSFGLFAYFSIRTDVKSNLSKIILTIAMFALIIVAVGGNFFINNTEIGREIFYYIFEKPTSGHLSTLVRMAPVYVDINAFVHYPLSGVGNGNQGFFYNEVVYNMGLSESTLEYVEFSSRLSGNMGVVSGGPFVPAFISGYGVLGIIFVVTYAYKNLKYMKKHKSNYGGFRYMYYIGMGTFLVLTTVSGSLDGNFVAMFVLSIPLIFEGEILERDRNEKNSSCKCLDSNIK